MRAIATWRWGNRKACCTKSHPPTHNHEDSADDKLTAGAGDPMPTMLANMNNPSHQWDLPCKNAPANEQKQGEGNGITQSMNETVADSIAEKPALNTVQV
jgi:hypothetical protein